MEKRRAFEERMTKECPLLYGDMYGDPRETIMTFGFDIGPGWYPIIEDLSPKLEDLIRPIYEKAVADPNTRCARCGRKRQWHWLFYLIYAVKYFFKNRVKALKAYPTWRKRDKSWEKRDKRLKKSVWKTLYFTLFKYKWFRACKRWTPPYPKAVQVKEKFGQLRLYMNYYVKEIEELITEAEVKSGKTCEDCGTPGELREGGWLVTLCDNCNEKRIKKGR